MASSNSVLEKLKTEIITGGYVPGKLYSEKEIVDNVRASRTPVREALKELAGEGLVRFVPKKGIMISPITIRKIKDIYEIRRNLETMALKKAIKNLQKKDIDHLTGLNDQYKSYLREKDYLKTFNIGKKFHLYIADISGNETLFKLIKDLRDESYRGLVYFVKQLYDNDLDFYQASSKRILIGHDNVIEAMSNNDEEKAVSHLIEDINLINLFLPLLNS